MTVGEAVQIAGTALESSRTERPVTYENIREKLRCVRCIGLSESSLTPEEKYGGERDFLAVMSCCNGTIQERGIPPCQWIAEKFFATSLDFLSWKLMEMSGNALLSFFYEQLLIAYPYIHHTVAYGGGMQGRKKEY